MSKISVIVPVYKVEQYLRECLDSIKQQTFTDWECLLIDDGSPDNSGKICDEYVDADIRFRVFHVENGGVSRARNIGLDNMTGEWVMFVDSDDAIDSNTFDLCINNVEKNNLDILQFSFARSVNELGMVDGIAQTEVTDLVGYIKDRNYLVCAGGSIFRSSIIQDNKLRFDVNLRLAEDQLFMYSFFNLSKRFLRLNNKLYWYRPNPSSAIHNSKSTDIENAAIKLSQYKLTHTLYSPIIDKVLLLFVIDLILNGDRGTKKIKYIYKRLHIRDITKADHSSKLLFYLSKISFCLAALIIKIRFK